MNVAPGSVHDPAFLWNGITELQELAAAFWQPLPASQSVLTLQVVFVCGAAGAWRLIEIARSRMDRRKCMLCFDSFELIRRAVYERLAWQRADAKFVADHMSTSTSDGFPGVTADWVPSKDFEWIFRSSRNAMRNETCTTYPKRTVKLS
jgi:hypothetical protein